MMGHDAARLCTDAQRRAVPCRAITHSKQKQINSMREIMVRLQYVLSTYFEIQGIP